MSQVHYRDSGLSLERLMVQSTDIVEVFYTGQTQLLKELVMPKETHHTQSHETVYQEFSGLYTIRSVVKSATLQVGADLQIYLSATYDEYLVRLYHAQGVSKSPIEEVYMPKYLIKDPNYFIAFLTPHGQYENVFCLDGSEGLTFLNHRDHYSKMF